MIKKDFIDAIAGKTGLLKRDVEAFTTAQATLAESTLRAGNDFMVPGVVTMKSTDRAARTGRNPATGDAVHIPAKRVVKAKPAHNLREF